MTTLLTSTGYGGTGSSAVTDILKEFGPVLSFGNAEFTFAHEPDGIADLENSLLEGHRLKTDLAIKRFLKLSSQLSKDYNYEKCFKGKFEELSKKYISTIISCEWNGWWHRVDETINYTQKQRYFIELLKEVYILYLHDIMSYELYEPDKWCPTYTPLTKEYYSNLNSLEKRNNFLDETKKFTDNLLQESSGNNNNYKYVLLDQAVPPISFSKYMRYFTMPKVIIVDRDPRDLYVMNKSFWGCGFLPTNNVELFTKWYLETRQSRKLELSNLFNTQDKEVLFMPFESLVYEYDNSLKSIMHYTVLMPDEHINKLKFFNPELSIKNTQFFLDYPDLKNDIKLIERNLQDYCYNFPQRKQNVCVRYFLIEEVNHKFNMFKENEKLSKEVKKYFFIALLRKTRFYAVIREKNKRGESTSSSKIYIKIIIYFLLLPINIFILCYRLNKQ